MQKKWKKVLIWILAVPAALSLVFGAAWFFLFRVNQFTLEVRLLGPEQMVLEYGESYREPGVTARLYGTLFFKDGVGDIPWTVTGNVDESRLERYTLDYSATLWGYSGSARRLVCLTDTQNPTITLTEDPEGLESGPYNEAGFSAWDNFDGDITDRVIRIEKPGLVTYAVVDSSGNPAYAQREIPYFDNLPPVLELTGGEHVTIPTGTVFTEPGWRVTDNADGDLSDAVEVSGEVCWYESGTYPITYTVRDAEGNETTVTRLVEVAPHPRPEIIEPGKKTIYLTFDDGPGPHTDQLLDVLDKYGVKATFFVTDSGYDETMAEIVRRGHAIGIHTVSHDYGEIYADPEAFYRDLYRMQEIIFENTGVRTTLMRFPGGSSNTVSTHSCEGIMTLLTRSVQDAGFQYFDWNIDSNDAGGAKTAKTVKNNVIDGIIAQGTGVVLQHDIHRYSVEAVEDILVWALDNGYTFEALTENSPGFHHDVNN